MNLKQIDMSKGYVFIITVLGFMLGWCVSHFYLLHEPEEQEVSVQHYYSKSYTIVKPWEEFTKEEKTKGVWEFKLRR